METDESPSDLDFTPEQVARIERLLAGSSLNAEIRAAALELIERFALYPEPLSPGANEAEQRAQSLTYAGRRSHVRNIIRSAIGD